ncbi:MAG: hypothetical protein ACP5D2_02890 [Candidatus Nanoarchaeia archaeon]
MAKTIEEVEKNTQSSFGYVKKDILMLNDALSDIHDKIRHLSMNHASLLEEMRRLREKVEGKKSKKTGKKKKKSSKKK